MPDVDVEALLSKAREARRHHAYAPYSDFHIGAAVHVEGDPPVTLSGGNVENASYGLSMCAERVALFRAMGTVRGAPRILALGVAGPNDDVTWPCGACRQVLHEFGPDMLVVVEGASGRRQQRPLSELLPEAFGPADLA